MDKNRYMTDFVSSFKIAFSKYQKQAFINQPENLEWASFI